MPGAPFDAAFSADGVRLYKPAPRVCRLAEGDFRCHASEMMVVSSDAWDAHAAADPVLADLSGLPALLAAGGRPSGEAAAS